MINTPCLDEIPIFEWLGHEYDVQQEEEIEDILKSRIWITARKRKIPVREMSIEHIQSCINCWNGKGRIFIPESYLGGKRKWLKIFKNELIKRQ